MRFFHLAISVTLGAFFAIAAPVFNVFWQETNHPHMPYAETLLVPASPCPLVDSRTCQEDCPNGLATDMGGCPVCRCKTLAGGSQPEKKLFHYLNFDGCKLINLFAQTLLQYCTHANINL